MLRRFVLLAVLLSIPALGQTAPRGLDDETMFDMESLSNPAISPDGSVIVFTRGWVDKMKDQHRSNLWMVNADGSRLRELTSGNWRDSNAVWSPDGKRIAFLSDRDGAMQLHVMWLDNRDIAQLTRVQKAPSNIKWSPDGTKLAFTMDVPDDDPVLPVKLPKRPEGSQWAKPAVIVDRLSWARDGTGPVPKGYTHVYVIDAATGGTPRQITGGLSPPERVRR